MILVRATAATATAMRAQPEYCGVDSRIAYQRSELDQTIGFGQAGANRSSPLCGYGGNTWVFALSTSFKNK